VLYAQGVFFIISLRIVSHARREQVFVFSFFPALNLPFEIFPLSSMLFYKTLDMCYCLQNFWQHFLHDAYCFKATASEDPCSGDYISH